MSKNGMIVGELRALLVTMPEEAIVLVVRDTEDVVLSQAELGDWEDADTGETGPCCWLISEEEKADVRSETA